MKKKEEINTDFKRLRECRRDSSMDRGKYRNNFVQNKITKIISPG